MLSPHVGSPKLLSSSVSGAFGFAFRSTLQHTETGGVFFGKTAQKLAINNLNASLKTLNFQQISGLGRRHGDCYFRAFFLAVPEAKR
jgi:hypothetical protein